MGSFSLEFGQLLWDLNLITRLLAVIETPGQSSRSIGAKIQATTSWPFQT
jgi:hypothetical protein